MDMRVCVLPSVSSHTHIPTTTTTPKTHHPQNLNNRLGFVREAADNPADWFVDLLSFAEPNHNHTKDQDDDNDHDTAVAAKPPAVGTTSSYLSRLLSGAGVSAASGSGSGGANAPATPVDGFDSSGGSSDGGEGAMAVIDLGGEETKQDATIPTTDADGAGVEMVVNHSSHSQQPLSSLSSLSLTRAFAASAEGLALEAEVAGVVAAASAASERRGGGSGSGGESKEEGGKSATEGGAVVDGGKGPGKGVMEEEYATTLGEQVRVIHVLIYVELGAFLFSFTARLDRTVTTQFHQKRPQTPNPKQNRCGS